MGPAHADTFQSTRLKHYSDHSNDSTHPSQRQSKNFTIRDMKYWLQLEAENTRSHHEHYAATVN